MQASRREKLGSHDNIAAILSAHPVPIVIIGAKFDAFANQFDTAIKKQLVMALRYVAHRNGADLVFASVREKLPISLFRNMLLGQLFDGSGASAMDINPVNPVSVRAGQDTIGKIDEPEGAGQRQSLSMESLWQ